MDYRDSICTFIRIGIFSHFVALFKNGLQYRGLIDFNTDECNYDWKIKYLIT